MNSKLSHAWKLLLFLLTLTVWTIWLAIYYLPTTSHLRIIACDVGQGDAILSIYGSTQILIDGGRGNRVMACLGKYIPFWDRKIELVILTHPQADHYEGLIDVFREYQVDTFLASGLDSVNTGYEVLKKEVESSETRIVNPKKGMKIGLEKIRLEILWPTDEFLASTKPTPGVGEVGTSGISSVLGAYSSNIDPNEFSVQALLTFKDFTALFTGDASPELSDLIAKELIINYQPLTLDYLKVPHHGSKNGLSENLLKVTNPEVAVISAGKENSYGHPHAEIIKLLEGRDIEILRTDEVGDVVIETDGVNLKVRP